MLVCCVIWTGITPVFSEDLGYFVVREARTQAPHRREFVYLGPSRIPLRGQVSIFCSNGNREGEQKACISLLALPEQELAFQQKAFRENAGQAFLPELYLLDYGPKGGIQNLQIYRGAAIPPLVVSREKLRKRIDEELAHVNSLEKFLDSIVVTRSVQQNPEFLQTLQDLNAKQLELTAKEAEFERKKVTAELLQSLSSDIRALEAHDSRLAQRGRALEEYLRKLVQSVPSKNQDSSSESPNSSAEIIAVLERPGPREDLSSLRAELVRLRRERQVREMKTVQAKPDSYIDQDIP